MKKYFLSLVLILCCTLGVSAQDSLKIVSYNIWDGFDNHAERRAGFVEWARQEQPDIFLLEELVGFKASDLKELGRDCGYPYTCILKEEWYPVGIMSKTPIEVVNRIVTPHETIMVQKKGLWHGLLHARSAGIDLLVTHLSPFDCKYRKAEAEFITHYADSLDLSNFLVAGDLNSYSPFDREFMDGQKLLVKRLKDGDRKRKAQHWANLTSKGRFDYDVQQHFIDAGLVDPVPQFVPEVKERLTHPSAYSRGLAPDDPALLAAGARIDYILLSPELAKRCYDAKVMRVEGVSDHYPVKVLLTRKNYRDPSLSVDERIDDMVRRMTLDEKVAQIRHIHSGRVFDGQQLNPAKLASYVDGKPWGFVEGFPLTSENLRNGMRAIQKYMVDSTRMGIPVFTIAESLHGAVHDGATVFPQNIALSSTFNPGLAYKRSAETSKDLHYQGIRQVLAPCIDVARDLRWGRVEETFGEDPMLTSRFALAEVAGYIDNGIAPMLKHFGPHADPMCGLNLASVNGSLSDFYDVHIYPFQQVVTKLPVYAVMSTYNSWNRVPNSASHYLLTEVLRDKWGFPGYVYSDWGSISMLHSFHHVAATEADAARLAISAGLDVEASSKCYPFIPQMIESGQLDEAILDEAVRRVLRAKFAAGLFDDPYGPDGELHSAESVKVAREIAEESVVMLKNDNNLLPLDFSKLKSIAVIGPNADQVQFGDYSWSRDNKDGVTPLAGLRAKAEAVGVKVNYAKGCSMITDDQSMIPQAVKAAKRSDVALVFVGSASAALARDYSSSTVGEGFDLHDLNLTGGQEQLVRAIHATGTPVVLVLVAGKPFTIDWEKENIPAILVQWYPGEQGGNAIADVIDGTVNPSGHLTVSFPRSTGHMPAYYNHLPTDRGFYHNPGERNRAGRDYVFSTPEPLWAFGYGMSYTDFKFSDLKVSLDGDTVRVSASVANTGKRAGKAVPQLYVRDMVTSTVQPIKQLKAFTKLELQPGETRQVSLDVAVDDLAYTNPDGIRAFEPGDFQFQLAYAADDVAEDKVLSIGQEKSVAVADANAVVGKHMRRTGRVIEVSGEVRDVQATLIPNAEIYSTITGSKIGTVGGDGTFRVKVDAGDALTFKKSAYVPETVHVNGLSTLNITLRNN